MSATGNFRSTIVKPVLFVLVHACFFVAFAGYSSAETVQPSPDATGFSSATKGSLVVRTAGLPKANTAAVTVKSRRFSKMIRRSGKWAFRVKPGRYSILVRRVKLRKAQGIAAGSIALPVKKLITVRVRAGREVTVDADYGTILAPSIQRLPTGLISIEGPPEDPTALVFGGRRSFKKGSIISSPPSSLLPGGLLARVTSVKASGGTTRVGVIAASPFDAAPNMDFNTPMQVSEEALVEFFNENQSCWEGGVNLSLSPYFRISNVRMSGAWVTRKVLFKRITTGIEFTVTLKTSAGISVTTAISHSCSQDLVRFTIHGMAGPIPVFGTIGTSVDLDFVGQASVSTGGSVDFTFGARISGVTQRASPIIRASNSDFFLEGGQSALEASLGFTTSAAVGIGVKNGPASLSATVGNTISFSDNQSECSWDLSLGSFSIKGKFGPFSVTVPLGTAYERNLWNSSCGYEGALRDRAVMTWNTDADIDLYAWDNEGNMASYSNTTAIDGANLNWDVIPPEGDLGPHTEVFGEGENPGRIFTFGTCAFRGAANVTMVLTDPDGTKRTIQQNLGGTGASSIVGTSPPNATGYTPPPGWCAYSGG